MPRCGLEETWTFEKAVEDGSEGVFRMSETLNTRDLTLTPLLSPVTGKTQTVESEIESV